MEILRLLKDIPISKDIIPVTLGEIKREGDVVGTITYEDIRKGKIIYEKT